MLVDSEVISCRAHAQTLTRHGYPITADQVLERFLGVSDREARQAVETEMGRKLPDDFEALMKQAALRRYASELTAIPHIGEAIGAGGLSGAPLKDRSLAVLRRLHSRVGDRLVLVAVGGIETADDAWTRIKAGATLIQAYTGFIYGGPLWPHHIHRCLARRARQAGYTSISQATGSLPPEGTEDR